MPDVYSVIGAILIVLAVISSALKKLREGTSERSVVRKSNFLNSLYEPIQCKKIKLFTWHNAYLFIVLNILVFFASIYGNPIYGPNIIHASLEESIYKR